MEYLLLRLAEGIAWLTPRPVAFLFARWIGRFAWAVVRIRRRVTLENLAYAFPEKTEKERRRIARGAYENLAMMGIELLRARHLDTPTVLDRVALDRESEAAFLMALREERGAIVVSGHYANWELLAARIAAIGVPSVVVVQDQRNPLMDRDLKATRRRFGLELAGRGVAVRSVLKTLQGGGAVLMLADQDAGTRETLFIDFFGRPASTYRGPATFSVRSGAPLIGAWIHREGGRYRARLERLDAEALTDLEPGADEETRIRTLTETYVAWLEANIRKDPSQYLWLHRRWKSRPAAERGEPG
jgi:KDO2-lipid IV(A) lauroyltransferase